MRSLDNKRIEYCKRHQFLSNQVRVINLTDCDVSLKMTIFGLVDGNIDNNVHKAPIF